MAYQLNDFTGLEMSIAMTARDDVALAKHLHKEVRQEDLAFAYWRPSAGHNRYTAIITEIVFPKPGDRILQGNVRFLAAVPAQGTC